MSYLSLGDKFLPSVCRREGGRERESEKKGKREEGEEGLKRERVGA